MKEYSPVWISTAEQLDRLDATYRAATLPAKLLGTFAIPEGTPHARGLLMPWTRVPLVCVAQGRLSLAGGRLAFAPTPFQAFGWLVRGTQRDLRWELGPSEIVAVEPADFSSPVARFFDIPFTRVRTGQPGLLGEFLLCVGGHVSMPKVRARSLELRRTLQAFAAGAGDSEPTR